MGTKYEELVNMYRDVILFGHASDILHWDRAVIMPEGGANARAEVMSFLDGKVHSHLVSDEMFDVLNAALEEENSLKGCERANLNLMKVHIEKSRIMPADLVAAVSKAASHCEHRWRTAKHENDFDAVRPLLTELINLKIQMADVYAEYLGCERYDALIDKYDPGRRSAQIDAIFKPLAENLPHILDDVLAAQPTDVIDLPAMSIADQQKLGLEIAVDLGFDFSAGRLDISAHPFSGGIADDVRMTSRYDENDYWSGVTAVIHETGHGIYDSRIARDWRYLAIGNSFNMGMSGHESMSLFMEKQVAHYPTFFDYFAKKLKATVGYSLDQDRLRDRALHIKRSFIRVDADEVTYPLHVILRYDLEKQIIGGDLKPADIPDAWREKSKELLGIIPNTDTLGCLQDIHWYCGDFGYFPCYTLGAIIGAQFFATANDEIENLSDTIGRGEFSPITDWLEKNIYSKGCEFTIDEILHQVTGQGINPEHYLSHLKQRYLGEA